MAKRATEKPSEREAILEKSKEARPSIDLSKPMSLGDWNKAFNATESPFN